MAIAIGQGVPSAIGPLEDQAAARRSDGYSNRWFLDPLYGKGYPADLVARFGAAMPQVAPDDLAHAAVKTDFLGVNYYFPTIARAGEARPLGFTPLTPNELAARGYELTEMGWPVVPQAFTELLTRLERDYAPGALYVTENGAAFADQPEGGQVHDPRRIAYLHGHIGAVQDAIVAGAPVRGYFVWSLMDNFEWGFGYSKRFGIVYIDYATQARILKDSAAWYRRVIEANALVDQ